jgi:hypothetical protein
MKIIRQPHVKEEERKEVTVHNRFIIQEKRTYKLTHYCEDQIYAHKNRQ